MASQQNPVRPWFRLPSIARTAPVPTPAPAPTLQSDQPPIPTARPTFVRPPFAQRPSVAQPTQPEVPVPPVATLPPSPVAAPRVVEPRSSTARPPPAITTSVPPSPIIRTYPTSSSLPTSPSSVSSTAVPVGSFSSVPSSPTPRVTTYSSSVPTSPSPKPVSPSPAAPPPSPVPVTAAATFSSTIIARTATPTPTHQIVKPLIKNPSPSPQIVKPLIRTPSPSPKTTKPFSHPPSPLTLPPAQLKSDMDHETMIPPEAEQKTVLVQETIEKPKATPVASNGDLHRYIGATQNHNTARNGKREVNKDTSVHKKFSSSEGYGMRVITIAGENKGAIMELSPARKKYDFGNNPHRLDNKVNHKAGWSDGNSSNEEGKSKLKDSSHKTTEISSLPLAAFMNSNVQGLNNSILYNSSFTHHDPGVHLSLSRKPDGAHLKDHVNGKHT